MSESIENLPITEVKEKYLNTVHRLARMQRLEVIVKEQLLSIQEKIKTLEKSKNELFERIKN
jgi:hypothetical protein